MKWPMIRLTIAFLLLSTLMAAAALAQAEAGATFSGQILYPDGTPASGASVVIMNLQSNQTYTTTTNETGGYEINNINADTGDSFDVTASITGYSGHRTTGITATTSLYEVNITLSETVNGFTGSLMWIATILGVIAIVIIFIAYVINDRKKNPPKRRRK